MLILLDSDPLKYKVITISKGKNKNKLWIVIKYLWNNVVPDMRPEKDDELGRDEHSLQPQHARRRNTRVTEQILKYHFLRHNR